MATFDVAAPATDEAAVEPTLAGLAPVGSGERISSIDVLRGFALLGLPLIQPSTAQDTSGNACPA